MQLLRLVLRCVGCMDSSLQSLLFVRPLNRKGEKKANEPFIVVKQI